MVELFVILLFIVAVIGVVVAPWKTGEPKKRRADGEVVRTEADRQTPHGAPEPEFEIEYMDTDGVVTTRQITPYGTGENPIDVRVIAYCHLRQGERTFVSSRIRSCRNLQTGRPIKNLGRYLKR